MNKISRKSGRVTCADIDVYYEEFGQEHEEVLLFLHGNGENSSYFQQQFRYFGGKYHIFALDTRAHGRSTRGSQSMDFNVLADDVCEFMNQMKLGQVNLLGFSDGGNTALNFALRYPDRLKTLIVSGANLYPEGMRFLSWIQIVLHHKLLKVCAAVSEKYRTYLEIWELMVYHPRMCYNDMRNIAVPALVIAGEHDVIRELHTRRIAEALPHGELAVIRGGDHFCAAGKPESFNRVVEAFLKEHC